MIDGGVDLRLTARDASYTVASAAPEPSPSRFRLTHPLHCAQCTLLQASSEFASSPLSFTNLSIAEKLPLYLAITSKHELSLNYYVVAPYRQS